LLNYKNYKNQNFEYEFFKRDYIEAKKSTNLPPTVFRKPNILTTFAVGLEDVLPKVISFRKFQKETKSTAVENELLSNVTGKLDFVVIVSFLLGLFAILYASTLIVGEKESGALKVVLSNSTKRSTFLLGKYLAGYVILIIPLVISLLLSLILLYLNGFPLFTGEILLRILSILVLSFLFLSTFFSLGLFISTRCHKTGVALITGFLVWIILTFVIPKISEPLANFIHPIQSREVVMMNRRQARTQIELEKGKRLEPIARKHVFGEGPRDFGKYIEERAPIAKEFEDRIDRTLNEYDAQHKKEKDFNTNLSLFIARLSPPLIFSNASLNFCRSGLSDRDNFFRSIDSHYIQLDSEYFKNSYDDMIVSDDGRSKSHISGTTGSDSELPEYNFQFLSYGDTLNKNILDILILVFYNLILFTAGYFSFTRYDVR
jgi:ABC-type transport system involved in multi-copper enzyme maturation permease subunit